MHVGRKCAAERQPVGAGLLLNDAPLATPALLHGDQPLDQFRPLNAGVGLDDAAHGIEANAALHRPRVDQHRSGGKLLTSHGMTAAGHRYGLAVTPSRAKGAPQRRLGIDRHHGGDAGLVQLGVDVIDHGARALRRRRAR